MKILILIMVSLMFETVYSQTLKWRLLVNAPIVTGNSRFEDIYFINGNIGWIINYEGATYKTFDAGNSWERRSFVPSSRCIGYFDSQTGIIGTLDSARPLYKTTDGGQSYTVITSLPSDAPRNIGGLSIANENTAYACGSYEIGKIMKTTDKGESWNVVFSDNSIAKTIIDCYFWTADSGIAVGGYNTSFFGFGNAVVIKTNDGGVTWQRVYKSTRIGEWCWKISFISRNTGFVSVQRGDNYSYVLKTTNSGLNWTEIPFLVYEQQGIGFINENTGWVGGWTGPTYETTNGGQLWQLAGWGRNMNRFRIINDSLAYAVGDRVYKYSVGSGNIPIEFPASYSLYQNSPNPFNPVTKIKFDVPYFLFSEGGQKVVSLKVYSSLGSEIINLVNEELSPGSYEAEFNGLNLSSGIYFYTLQAGDFSDVKRMVLLK